MSATQAAYGFPTATPESSDFVLIAKGMKRRLATPATLAALMAASARVSGVKTMAATGNQSLAVADLGKLVLVPNTGALEIALPAAALCTGRGFIIKKTNAAAQAITINPDASETIDGGATFASQDANNDVIEIVSDGTGWQIVAKAIA